MNTKNIAHRVMAVAVSVLVILSLTFSAVLAKDRFRTPGGSSNASDSTGRVRGGNDGSTGSDANKLQQRITINPGDAVGLNPQPLPPKALQRSIKIDPGGPVELNPQPLPPR